MVDVILARPDFAYLAGKFENRRNPLATKFHYALASLEDQLLQESLPRNLWCEYAHSDLAAAAPQRYSSHLRLLLPLATTDNR